MKKLFASFTENTHKKLREQEEKHAMEIAAMKRANMDTQNLITTKTAPTQTMNDHRTSAHLSTMTKPSEILFDGKPENCLLKTTSSLLRVFTTVLSSLQSEVKLCTVQFQAPIQASISGRGLVHESAH
jgi:hypothetical protein